MKGITEKSGIPHIWGIPCRKDQSFEYSRDALFSLTEWLCPFCQQHLGQVYGRLLCLNHCHLIPLSGRKPG